MLISTRPNFIMPVQNFGGPTQINFRGQNVHNLARFWTTLKFGGGYLRINEGIRNWTSTFCIAIPFALEKYFIYRYSSCVRRNKSGEVWSSNLGDLDVKSYSPKTHFSEEHISAPRGCCAPKFLHLLEYDQILLTPSPSKIGPPYNFFQRGIKNWLNVVY